MYYPQPSKTKVIGRDKITLAMVNLSTHALSSLYKAFPTPEARRIAKRLDIHYTPRHEGWLIQAYIPFGFSAVICRNGYWRMTWFMFIVRQFTMSCLSKFQAV